MLNNPTYKGEVLVAGKNFGSGSSREHAAWAIGGMASGWWFPVFRRYLPPQALNNGILPVAVSEEFLGELFVSVKRNSKATVTVNLQEQTITNNETGKSGHLTSTLTRRSAC